MASSKRERELARMRAERQAARRSAAEARSRQRRRTLLSGLAAVTVIAVISIVAISVGGKDKKPVDTLGSAPTSGATGSTGASGAGACSYDRSGTSAKPIKGVPPTTGVITTGVRKAVIVTSRGTVEADLLASKAPCTVNSFAFLAAQKYYNGTACHRLVTSGIFVLQCGDPTGTGSGGPGYKYADENLTGATYPAGTLAMANGGPGTNGSQFFLVYKDTQLGPQYTPFGTITKGLDILVKQAAGGDDGSISAGGGKPKLPISLKTVTVS